MKKILLLALLACATPAYSQDQPNLIDEMTECTHESIIFTQLADAAQSTPDDKKATFDAFIDEVAERQQGPQAQAFIRNLGEIAWHIRGHDATSSVAMHLYQMCMDSTGLKA